MFTARSVVLRIITYHSYQTRAKCGSEGFTNHIVFISPLIYWNHTCLRMNIHTHIHAHVYTYIHIQRIKRAIEYFCSTLCNVWNTFKFNLPSQLSYMLFVSVSASAPMSGRHMVGAQYFLLN